MLRDHQVFNPGDIIDGRFRILCPLGKGGMGAVYLAEQLSLGRKVAIKVILDTAREEPELMQRFQKEARAVCLLKHPNIITYHDYGVDPTGRAYLVMEYLDGLAGTRIIYAQNRPTVHAIITIALQIASALQAAHSTQIIHRDLKWSNVMVTRAPHNPLFAKLIDFGILKDANDADTDELHPITRPGALVGTPEYMSPEAIRGAPIDGRTDQYALGIMLYEAIEGQRPFRGRNQFDILRQQVENRPPPFSHGLPTMRRYPRLSQAIFKSLEKSPAKRFATMRHFSYALKRAVGMTEHAPTLLEHFANPGISPRNAPTLAIPQVTPHDPHLAPDPYEFPVPNLDPDEPKIPKRRVRRRRLARG